MVKGNQDIHIAIRQVFSTVAGAKLRQVPDLELPLQFKLSLSQQLQDFSRSTLISPDWVAVGNSFTLILPASPQLSHTRPG
jgi:hypothetical protein